MKFVLRATSVRTIILTLALGATACAEAKKPDRASLLPTFEAMKPVVVCLGNTKPGDNRAAETCASNGGITLAQSKSDPPTLNDFKLQAVVTWLFLDRDPARRMSATDFDQALDFARCVETAAFADRDFSSRTERGVAAAQIRAEAACREHPLSMMRVSPEAAASGKPIESAAQMMVAKTFSGMSLTYALEANGLMTDAMRPCVRYLDGRPPSRGCKGKPQPTVTQPPAPPQPPAKN
jgi:hypothetical protein